MKRILSIFIIVGSLIVVFSPAAFSQGGTCATSELLCDPNVSFPLATGGSEDTDTDCWSSSQSGPNWYTLAVGESGVIDVTITATPCVDVDYGIWGPFEEPTGNCGVLDANRADCSFAGGCNNETFNITGEQGEFYVLLITNYTNAAGVTVDFVQNNAGDPGAGALGGPLSINSLAGTSLFIDDPVFTFVTTPALDDPDVTGENFTGTGITDATLGEFTPSVAGVGTHTITLDANSYSCPVTVNADMVVCPIITAATAVGGGCEGDGVTLTATTDPGPLAGGTLQWQVSSDNATWTNIAGATTSVYNHTLSLTAGASTCGPETQYFRAVLTCTGDPTLLSIMNAGSATVYPEPLITDLNIQLSCSGGSILSCPDVTISYSPTATPSSEADYTSPTPVLLGNVTNQSVYYMAKVNGSPAGCSFTGVASVGNCCEANGGAY